MPHITATEVSPTRQEKHPVRPCVRAASPGMAGMFPLSCISDRNRKQPSHGEIDGRTEGAFLFHYDDGGASGGGGGGGRGLKNPVRTVRGAIECTMP